MREHPEDARIQICPTSGKTFHGIIVDQGADCELIEPQLRMHCNRVAIATRCPGAFEGI